MDTDLIKLVNKLQDTFNNLGVSSVTFYAAVEYLTFFKGGELDMPQLVVVRRIADLKLPD
jgi:hypothetical protein